MTIFELIGGLTALIAVFGYLNHRFIKLPDTIGITAVGLACSLLAVIFREKIPGMTIWTHQVVNLIDFPEVVFHGMLGMLLFAGSLHVNVADIAKQKTAIVLLSTVGVVISTAVVGFGGFYLFDLVGHPVPLIYCLLFGALISPTDPVAVLGLLKKAGVSKSLETKITGEALFNDGTAVVAFLVLLGIASGATVPTVPALGLMLAKEIFGAIALGLAAGYAAFFLLKGVDSYPVEILITLSLATGGYALAEHLHVSAPIAVVVMGLVIGNHGALSVMSEKTRQHLFGFWELIDEILTLMLFGLIGIVVIGFTLKEDYLVVSLVAIPLVLMARFASVGIPMTAMYAFHRTAPNSVKIMTWGGLRGGISIALALSLPPFAERELIIVVTYAVVVFSLLVQAPTLGPLLRRLQVCGGAKAEVKSASVPNVTAEPAT
jgi:CPA1 family monovalent cation:H+ antiporter